MILERKNTHSKHAFVFRVACPSCGAPVSLQAASSLMAVCSYCTATLIRQDDQLIASGEKSAVLKDYSTIQIGSVGIFEKKTFSVIGLWQIVYDKGFWNEWYIVFADGSTAWLAEFNGFCSITFLSDETIKKISLSSIVPGFSRFRHFLAADVREIDNIACHAQGELPFSHDKLNQTKIRLADFRKQDQFITLDIDNDNTASLYQGKVLHFLDLNLKNTRSKEAIKESAGNLRGLPQAFSCPKCGYSLKWYPGIADIIHCQACLSKIKLSNEKITLIKTENKRNRKQDQTSLKLGAVLPLINKKWTVIGIIKYREFEFNQKSSKENIQKALKTASFSGWHPYTFTKYVWYEYLLYCPGQAFIFLTESTADTGTQWQITYSKTLWPDMDYAHHITTNKGKIIKPSATYLGVVHFAIGAFNWHVAKGDVVFCHNYDRFTDTETDGTGLSLEITAQEMNWSASRPLSKKERKDCSVKNIVIRDEDDHSGWELQIAIWFIIININLIFEFEPGWTYYIFAIPLFLFIYYFGFVIIDKIVDKIEE